MTKSQKIFFTKDVMGLPNIRQFPRTPKALITTDEKIKLDKNGIRQHNVRGTKTLLTVGCSHTFGQGLESKDVWAHKLAEMLQFNLVNVGTPGASVGICTTNLLWAIENYDIDLVVWYCPTPDRLEYYRNDKSISTTYASNTLREPGDPKNVLKWKNLYVAGMNKSHYIPALQMLRQSFSLLKFKNIPSVFNFWGWDKSSGLISLCNEYNVVVNDDPQQRLLHDRDRALDNEHFGVISHEEFAKNNYNLIKNQLTNL
jgi:hypothetical protein